MDSVIEGAIVRLDGKVFKGVTFRKCILHYGGGDCEIEGCIFDGSLWVFDQAARHTLEMLSGMYRDGAVNIIEDLFQQVRCGYFRPFIDPAVGKNAN